MTRSIPELKLLNMSEDFSDTRLVIECIDHDFPGTQKRRILIDAARREVTFVNCLWPRKFLASGYENHRCCPFEDILSARDFGAGQLRRLVISTRQGSCAVSADWDGFEELREALQKIATVTDNGYTLDNPWVLMPLMFVVVFGIVGGIIYLLL